MRQQLPSLVPLSSAPAAGRETPGTNPQTQNTPHPALHQLLPGPETPGLPFCQALKKSENKRPKKVFGCKNDTMGHEYGKSSY